MWDLRVCAACLATDVRLHSMSAGRLHDMYRTVSGLQYGAEREVMPQKLCYECAVSVSKYHSFRHKCERAHRVLQQMYDQHDEINEQIVRKIDRKKLLLASSYSICETKLHTYNGKHIEDTSKDETEKELNTHEIRPNSVPDMDADEMAYELDIKKEEADEFDFDLPLLNLDIKEEKDSDVVIRQRLKRKDGKKRKRKKEMRSKDKNKHKKKEVRVIEKDIVCKDLQSKDVRSKGNTRIKGKLTHSKEKVMRGKNRKKRRIKEENKLLKKLSRKRIPHNKKLDCGTFAVEVMLTQEQQMEEVRKRQESAAYKESPYKCVQCYKSFIDDKTYKNHMLKHDPVSGQYECDVCKNRYRLRRHVVNHIYKVHMRKYLCRFCSFVSLTPEQANNHNNWHTGVTYKCNICDEVFTKKSTQLSHLRLKHPSEHICGVCGESFVSKRGLVLHTRFMHKESVEQRPPQGAPYCAECSVQFTTHEAWNKHLLISPKHAHDNQIANGCRECGESFPTESDLRMHQRTHLKKRRRNVKNAVKLLFPLQCAQCDETIPNAMKYWQHFRRAHPAEKYPAQKSVICEHCGKGFQTNAQLVYHRYTHSGKRAYQCAVCAKSFYTPTQLWTHSKSHDESRPHVCDICRKGFKIKPALARHMRIHTGEKPFACDVCGKAFTDASSRKLHVRTVHLKEPAPYASRARLDKRRAADAVKNSQLYQF